ncbi:Carbohydrate esterase family 9 protein [Mycena indigotica]|uniref:Carbohydrate esterase family 9 protein n=1 Tax=Mycena indigotica TaxID=2126181 RepID=A0A8H6SM20_9AGAR|nr:Carbohydrate esterase family 9 protein [Mycena indigotica]KAF7301819.1 Carbohydrate esterase family 9 protein [Mycena indigotica]
MSSSAAIRKYLGLEEGSQPDPETEPILFLKQYLTAGLPPQLLLYFSSVTTPKQRSVLPAIRNRRLKYTSTNPPELGFTSASTTWPLLYEGQQGRRGQREGEAEKTWADKDFLQGSTKHREAERVRTLRRQKVEEFVPEEESDSDDEPMESTLPEPVDEDDAKATFERVIRERFIYGLLEGIDYDKADWDEAFDSEMDRDAEDSHPRHCHPSNFTMSDTEHIEQRQLQDSSERKKKKKKGKHSIHDILSAEPDPEVPSVVEHKKKKRKHEDDADNKPKKKKKRRDSEDPEVLAESDASGKEKKKRKRKHDETVDTAGEGTEQSVQPPPQKEKRRKDSITLGSASLLPLPSQETFTAFFPSLEGLDSNEDILRALQNADLSSHTQGSSTNVPSKPRTATSNTSTSKKASKPRKSKSTLTDTDTSDHAELLATKWLNSDQLAALAKEQGLVYKKGVFSTFEAKLAADAVVKYQTLHELAEEDIDRLIFPDTKAKKDSSFWSEIARAVPQRPLNAIYHHLRRARHPLKQQGKWTEAEDEKLIQAVVSVGKHWEKVSTLVGRQATDCRDRYRNYLKDRDARQTGPWTAEEEEKLSEIVLELQEGKDLDYDVPWTQVAELMGGTRGRQQCRIKWLDKLNLKHKTNGTGARWSRTDAEKLINKIAVLNVRDDTEIDWKTLREEDWNLWSAHVLQRRWLNMKRAVKGYEDMTIPDIISTLQAKNIAKKVEFKSREFVETVSEVTGRRVACCSQPCNEPRVSRSLSSPSAMSGSPRIPLLVFLVTLFAWIFDRTTYFPHKHVFTLTGTDPAVKMPPAVLKKCTEAKISPGASSQFAKREVSDRFEPGVNTSWLITNATLVVGRGNATHWIQGDLYLDKGIIKAIGNNLATQLSTQRVLNLTVVNANRRWVTAGLGMHILLFYVRRLNIKVEVDIHSHLGALSTPFMAGNLDLVSSKGPTTPWLQVIDGFNTHDEAFQLAMAGGVTSALIQSGGKNTIGSQAFVAKLRPTVERSPSSMLVEPRFGSAHPQFWRHLVQACGETPSEYGTRLDAIWSLRSAYAQAREIIALQDSYCEKATAGLWSESMGAFPEDLRVETLVDVLRGKVKVSALCQEAVDIDALVRLTNEFEFPIASLQHASEAWLVPHLLNRTWGGLPTVALFASNYQYDVPSFRGSEHAARILADLEVPVALKSQHPVINSRYLAQEAQVAHYYGLPPRLALASVTSVPAKALGLDHRIGVLEEGADADVVLWDSNPLQLGATPIKVWIDGQLQIPLPRRSGEKGGQVQIGVGKDGRGWSEFPDVPDWQKERSRAIEWEGLPPLANLNKARRVIFDDVRTVHHNGFIHTSDVGFHVVAVDGRIDCIGNAITCSFDASSDQHVNLDGGVIVPGMMTFGSTLGTEEIHNELSTGAGLSLDALSENVPEILKDPGAMVYAVDSLMFGTRNALSAYRSGITTGTVVGAQGDFIAGVSTTFSTGRLHAMERGAILQKFSAMHVSIHRSDPFSKPRSVNNQIAALRRLLLGWESQASDTGTWFKKAAEGIVPLVVDVDSADIMATLLILKADIEDRLGSRMRMVFNGAAESHILAREIGRARIGVILDAKPVFGSWETLRGLPGPPITNDTTLATLIKEGVKVGLRCKEAQNVKSMGFDLRWAMLAANGVVTQDDVYALVSSNLRELLGVTVEDEEFVAYSGGGPLNMSSKVVAVIASGAVDILPSFHEDMVTVESRLPTEGEFRRVRHLVLQQLELEFEPISDDDIARVFAESPHLESVVLSAVPGITDRSVVLLTDNALNLQGIDISGCNQITDVSIFELSAKSLPLQWILLNGVTGLTDASITALAKTCSRLSVLELCDLPLLSAHSVRDIFTYSRKLRTLRLARCPLLTDKAFPAISASRSTTPVTTSSGYDKPLPPRPTSWFDELPPLILRHTADNLRVVDLSFVTGITDAAIDGLVSHAPRIQNLRLTGCKQLSDKTLESISKLGDHLDVLLLAHVSEITDNGIVKLARSCTKLRCIDVGFCRNLTDLAVFCLAELRYMRRLSLVRVHRVTDIAIFALAEHALDLERLNLSYCDRLSLDALHLLLKRLMRLQNFAATGIPSLKRKGVHRFSDMAPPVRKSPLPRMFTLIKRPQDYDADQQAAYNVFTGERVSALKKFLNKEETRRRECEAKNIRFTESSDDGIDLY